MKKTGFSQKHVKTNLGHDFDSDANTSLHPSNTLIDHRINKHSDVFLTPTDVDNYISGSSVVADSEEFNIEINFDGLGWTTELSSVFIRCADYLSSIVTNDISSITEVSDLTISASLNNIDGVGGAIGSSQIVDQWSDSLLPSSTIIALDIADAQTYLNSGQLDSVVLHEMIHSLGFGALWESLGLISVDTAGDVVYTGAALDELNSSPEIELDGALGTAYVHWDEEIYANELMTGYIDTENTITDMTLMALADLGYVIDGSSSITDAGLVGVVDGYSSVEIAVA